MSEAKSRDRLAAHLFLEAVLPAFEELPMVSAPARALVAGWNCAVELAVRNLGRATMHFRDGAILVSPNEKNKPALSLFFLSPRHLVQQMKGNKMALPFPGRGFFRLTTLMHFQKVSALFEKEIEHQPRLLLSVAMAAMKSLSEHDPETREILRAAPSGLAQFGIPASELFGWIENKSGRLFSGRGRAPRLPDVTIEFRDETTALAALRGELDELAAMGAGDLRVRGLIPLAEILGVVADRVAQCLPRKSRA